MKFRAGYANGLAGHRALSDEYEIVLYLTIHNLKEKTTSPE
jgi:hypothetical protein